MTVLLAVFVHNKHDTVRIRVVDKRDAQRYVGHGWRLVGFDYWPPKED